MKSKEYYSLLWEYLKRSEKYLKFCEMFSNKNALDIFASDDRLKLEKKYKINSTAFLNYYSFFGNVHQENFDDWWNENGDSLTSKRLIISDLANDAKFHSHLTTFILGIVYNFRGKVKYSAGEIYEITNKIKTFFSYADRESIYIKLNLTGNKNYIKTSKEIVKLIKEKQSILQLPNLGNVSRFMKKELHDYLNVYDLKKNMTYREIIQKIGDEKQQEYADHPDIWNIYARKVRFAKRIIKNIECGQFPGKYSD